MCWAFHVALLWASGRATSILILHPSEGLLKSSDKMLLYLQHKTGPFVTTAQCLYWVFSSASLLHLYCSLRKQSVSRSVQPARFYLEIIQSAVIWLLEACWCHYNCTVSKTRLWFPGYKLATAAFQTFPILFASYLMHWLTTICRVVKAIFNQRKYF